MLGVPGAGATGELPRKAKVVIRTKDRNGDVKGLCEPNPFLNTLTCDIELTDAQLT